MQIYFYQVEAKNGDVEIISKPFFEKEKMIAESERALQHVTPMWTVRLMCAEVEPKELK